MKIDMYKYVLIDLHTCLLVFLLNLTIHWFLTHTSRSYSKVANNQIWNLIKKNVLAYNLILKQYAKIEFKN